MIRETCTAQQSAETYEQEPGLMNTETPQHSDRFITGVGFKILANAGIQ